MPKSGLHSGPFRQPFDGRGHAALIGPPVPLHPHLEGATELASPPSLGAGAARIHIGGSGRQTLVSWRGSRELFYQEHDGVRWLPRQSLALTDTFTVDQAYALLDGKAR